MATAAAVDTLKVPTAQNKTIARAERRMRLIPEQRAGSIINTGNINWTLTRLPFQSAQLIRVYMIEFTVDPVNGDTHHENGDEHVHQDSQFDQQRDVPRN